MEQIARVVDHADGFLAYQTVVMPVVRANNTNMESKFVVTDQNTVTGRSAMPRAVNMAAMGLPNSRYVRRKSRGI